MAKIVKNEKDFKVFKLSRDEFKKIGYGIDWFGNRLCMRCNKLIKGDIYYPVILHDTMDKDCFEQWLADEQNHPTRDKELEEMEYKGFMKVFNNLNFENE